MITLRNDEVYPVNFKVYVVHFIENIGDHFCMVGLISGESLSFGLLIFFRLIDDGAF